MHNEDRVRIQHMIEAAESVAQFVSKRERSDLETDRLLLFAVVRAVEVLGEAAARVSEETREKAPDIPWSAIVSMRNRLIHGYFDIDTEIVWKTATKEIPALLPKLKAL
jgi:uncharacterized protein with HEPN domain